MSYLVSPLSEVLSKYPEEQVSQILSSFSCERDKDVESFLRDKAIVQEKKQTSRTYLIFDDDTNLLVAYFALAISIMEDKNLKCSNRMQRKMNFNNNVALSYLIGPLGKRDGSAKGLGMFAIEKAISCILKANEKVGCRVIRIDCRESLIEYYENNGFTPVGCNAEGNLNLMVRIIETDAVAA